VNFVVLVAVAACLYRALVSSISSVRSLLTLLALMIFCLKSSSNFVLGVMPLICKSLSLPQILFKKSMRLVRFNQRQLNFAMGIYLRQRTNERTRIPPTMPTKFHQAQSPRFYVSNHKRDLCGSK
jgi:hypothetical protein